jgi:hypothetical protein
MHKSSICLCGVEGLEPILKQFPDVPDQAGIDPIDSPLIVSRDELAEIVYAAHLIDCLRALDAPPI